MSAGLGGCRRHSLFLGITGVLPRLVPFIDSAALSARVTIGQSLFSPSFPAPFPGLCLCSSVTQQKARGAAPRPLNGRRPAALCTPGGRGREVGVAAGLASPGWAPPAPSGPASLGEKELWSLRLSQRWSLPRSQRQIALVEIASSKLLLSAFFSLCYFTQSEGLGAATPQNSIP